MVRTLTLVDGPALKSAAISGRVARLSRLRVLVSRRWSRSCMIFFRPQRCRRFDVLLDSRYSVYIAVVARRLSTGFTRLFGQAQQWMSAPFSSSKWFPLQGHLHVNFWQTTFESSWRFGKDSYRSGWNRVPGNIVYQQGPSSESDENQKISS
ncbi:hypothetical protein AVEN_28680-1 [Araneus ventricosus]|uniref:Uncharacterized protein n=1 Tax=Araneus ventricosus TaxID=182803 RepID=A0A4Y2K784_ARAVE|nr:hypothetical protein AVEN_28680-1 [Araneus ventricosus]